MTWTGRNDDTPCCGDSPGAVASNETVAKYFHSGISEPKAGFKRDRLKPPRDFTNNCGEADGLSVDRSDALSLAELRARSAQLAGQNREPLGGHLAHVADLRAITLIGDPHNRGVYVYDDPLEGNREHAVIRVSEHADRAEFDRIRDAIMQVFSVKFEQS